MIGFAKLMNGKIVGSHKLLIPPDKYCLGSIRICVESAHVPEV